MSDDDQHDHTIRTVLTGKQILLVDDDPEVRSAIKAMLTRVGCVVIEAGNGEEALLQYATFNSSIDFILSDVVMPVMGGSELAVRLRHHHGCTVPLVLLSGYVPEEDIDMDTLQEQIDGFIHKPVDFRTLTSIVGRLLHNHSSSSTTQDAS